MERHVGIRAQRLAQLLGPATAEIGCDECFDLLDEFVELELAGLDADATFLANELTSRAVGPSREEARLASRTRRGSESLTFFHGAMMRTARAVRAAAVDELQKRV